MMAHGAHKTYYVVGLYVHQVLRRAGVDTAAHGGAYITKQVPMVNLSNSRE